MTLMYFAGEDLKESDEKWTMFIRLERSNNGGDFSVEPRLIETRKISSYKKPPIEKAHQDKISIKVLWIKVSPWVFILEKNINFEYKKKMKLSPNLL